MKEVIMNAIGSKRFIAFAISIILFVVLALFTPRPLMEIAGAIALIAGIYIGGDTLRSSNDNENKIKT